MHIERIYIQDNFVPNQVEDPFRRKVIGIGVFIKEGESMADAETTAEKYISEYIQNNTHYPDHAHIEIRNIPPEEDKEFEELKIALALIEYKEDAQAYLDKTDFKHAFEAKILIKNKPNKL